MEHLFFGAHDAKETVAACREPVLRADWQECDRMDLIDFIPPRTPWLGFEHDSIAVGPLESYPVQAGFNVDHLWKARFRESHPEFALLSSNEVSLRVVGMLQAWLYFGLLENIVEKKIEVSYLARFDTDDICYLYSRKLHFCLQAKVFAMRADPDRIIQSSMDVQTKLRLVHMWISRFMNWSHTSFRPKIEEHYPGFMDALECVLPAIIRLAETIEQTRMTTARHLPTLGTLHWNLPFLVTERRSTRLKELGWCDFQISLLEDTVNQSTIDWIVAKEMKQDNTGHETCSRAACVRNNIDESTYRQAHICESKQCGKLIPSVHQIEDILRADEIPVIILEMLNGVPLLKVASSCKARPRKFIAFSHVWVDGLGGASEHGLYRCQVERLNNLAKSVAKASSNVPFWLDSLCIPRTDQEIYFKALVGIRNVYLNAASVIVVDKTIQKCTTSCSTEVLYAHIYLSAWMQRMWTYEEAVLAKELLFVLEDGFHMCNIPNTKPSMRSTVNVVWQSLATQLHRLRAQPDKLNIGHIYQAFKYRLTNAKQEEFLSVSGMLNLHTAELLQVKGDERVRKFWIILKTLPFNIPFLTCPKLSAQGFRWAPKTLMYPTKTKMDTDNKGRKSDCTTQGLIGTYLIVLLQSSLFGSQRHSASVFNIWVDNTSDSSLQNNKSPAFLRLYCNEPWPEPPTTCRFDTIAFAEEEYRIQNPGKTVVGVALLRQNVITDNIPDPATIQEYQYIGRLLVERLQAQEMVSAPGSLMFEGAQKARIDASGGWSIRKICIT